MHVGCRHSRGRRARGRRRGQRRTGVCGMRVVRRILPRAIGFSRQQRRVHRNQIVEGERGGTRRCIRAEHLFAIALYSLSDGMVIFCLVGSVCAVRARKDPLKDPKVRVRNRSSDEHGQISLHPFPFLFFSNQNI